MSDSITKAERALAGVCTECEMDIKIKGFFVETTGRICGICKILGEPEKYND